MTIKLHISFRAQQLTERNHIKNAFWVNCRLMVCVCVCARARVVHCVLLRSALNYSALLKTYAISKYLRSTGHLGFFSFFLYNNIVKNSYDKASCLHASNRCIVFFVFLSHFIIMMMMMMTMMRLTARHEVRFSVHHLLF